jgi:hypothetical protein
MDGPDIVANRLLRFARNDSFLLVEERRGAVELLAMTGIALQAMTADGVDCFATLAMTGSFKIEVCSGALELLAKPATIKTARDKITFRISTTPRQPPIGRE